MKNRLWRCFLIYVLLLGNYAFAQVSIDRIVEIDGVAMTADSLRAVSYATIQVKNQDRGVNASLLGVFSIVCYKGDTLEFTCTGFRPKEFIVPTDLKEQHYSLIQLMVQDTFYLPETIIRPLMSREEFNYAFQHWRIPNDYYEKARRNTNSYIMRALAYTLPHDGGEAQSRTQAQMAKQAVYYGQRQPMNIFSPLAWGEFFESWKRGDFRRKDNPYMSEY